MRHGRPELSAKTRDTSTWGKRLAIRSGVWSPGDPSPVDPPFGPFTPSPDILLLQRLVDVRAPTDKPSITSRDVTAYILARQLYDNNPSITTALPQDENPPAVTPLINQHPAFEGLYGRLTTSRGGVSSFEDFNIPAQGVSMHIGSDTARLEVVFDPARAGITDATDVGKGKLAAGFSVVGGVASSGFYPDTIRQFLELVPGGGATLTYRIPQFSRLLQFTTPVPQIYVFEWLDFNGVLVANTPSNGIPYANAPAPIPVNAESLRITQQVAALTSPILTWHRLS